MDYLTTHTNLSPIRRGFAPGLANYKIGCTRLAAASNEVYQLLNGRWFSLSPASSTTKTGRHDIAEILLKEAFKHQKSKFILGAVHAMLLVGAYMDRLCHQWVYIALYICMIMSQFGIALP